VACQTPLEYCVCQHAIAPTPAAGGAGHVQDSRLVGKLAMTVLGISAYAGVPLISEDGWTEGTLCVMDFVPRTGRGTSWPCRAAGFMFTGEIRAPVSRVRPTLTRNGAGWAKTAGIHTPGSHLVVRPATRAHPEGPGLERGHL
jgi:hypothetical protein